MKRLAVVLTVVLILHAPVLNAEERLDKIHLDLISALKKAETMPVGVLIADARVEQSMARLQASRSSLLPQVTGIVSGARQTKDMRSTGIQFPSAGPEIGPYNSFDARGRITQVLFDAGAFERLRAAKMGGDLSKVQYQKAKEDALALTATMYIQAKRSEEHLALARALLTRDRLALNIQQGKLKQGTGSALALKEAKADYAQSRYYFRSSKADALQKRLDLAALLKLPLRVPIIFDDTDDEKTLGKIRFDHDSVKLLDVKSAEAQVYVQEAQTAAAKADFGPKITAVGDYGRSGETPDRGSNTYMIGLQASIPIWEGGIKSANLEEAKARQKEAVAVLEDTKNQSQIKIIDAREDIKEARALIAAKSFALSVADEELAIVQERLRSGIGHALDLAAAGARRAGVLDARREAIAFYWMSKINLAHLLGQMEMLMKE